MNTEEYIQLSVNGKLNDEDEKKLKALGATLSRSNSLLGGEISIEVLILLTATISIRSLKDIVVSIIKSKGRVKLKTKEITLETNSVEEAISLLDKLKDSHHQKNGN